MKLADSSYCFVSSGAPAVIEAARRLAIPEVAGNGGNGRICLFASSRSGGEQRHLYMINDQADYTDRDVLEHAISGGGTSPPYDSLVSAAFIDGPVFRCISDYWGLREHYWYEDRDTFVCSDNIFNVAALTDRDISEESLFEYLFFLSPIRDHTWFAGIRCLLPGQGLAYDRRARTVLLSEPLDCAGDLLGENATAPDIAPAVRSFFSNARRRTGAGTAAITLSAGSDSRTVLAGLISSGFPLKAYSFGTPALYETREIERLTRRFGIDWRFIDIDDTDARWFELFRESTADSNGLLNPLRTHYEILYGTIPADEVIFEGILGSQFLKGEHCVGATISAAHRDSITGGASPERALETHFAFLGELLYPRMREYILDRYGGELLDVDTPRGLRAFQSFAFSVFPRRIFAGMVMIAGRDHGVYLPFISPCILKAVLGRGFGIARNVSLRSDAHGYIRSVLPESVIVRELDRRIYTSVLDRNFSFREVLEYPFFLVRLLKAMRVAKKKVRYRNCVVGQIDNSRIEGLVARYAHDQAGTCRFIDALVKDGRHFKEAAQIGMIRSIKAEFAR